MGATDRLRPHLGQPEMTHIPGADQIADRARRLLDRHRRIEPRRLIQIDVVRPQAPQRIGKEVAHCRRPCVIAAPPARRIAQRAELHLNERAIAPPLQRSAEQHLVMPHAVEIARVEQRDAGIQRRMDRRDAFVLICRTVQSRHPHAAEPQSRHLRPRRTKRAHADHP